MAESTRPRFAATELTAEDTRRFLLAAGKETKRATASQESARKFLVRLGTHTKAGNLTARYR